MRVGQLILTVAVGVVVATSSAGAKDKVGVVIEGWPATVAGVTPAGAGEHPRLLFRRGEIAALREKAATPEGKAILARLRGTLDGANGETFPKLFNGSGHAYQGNKAVSEDVAAVDNGENNSNKSVGKSEDGGMPLGTFTMSHAAGYGLLYQLTGEKKFAELGQQAMQKSLDGVRDRDDRYSFRKPGGALRCGPSLGWTALGYDLCYDGWSPEFRQKVVEEISKYNEGPQCAIEECILGKRQFPGSNHWGMEVGGSALAMLAIYGDPGCDMKKFEPLFEQSQAIMIRNMTEGFGDGGFFAEGDGTGSMSSHIVFLTALQAWKGAFGKDFVSPRPNAQWMANKWFLLTVAKDGKADFFPQRGAYAHNIWARGGLSGGGYFSIGMGVATSDEVKSALLWYYNHGGFAVADEKGKTPLDTPSPYPHHAVLSFVNWPIGKPEKDPNEVLPHAVHDAKWGFYAWRSRWAGPEDVVISILSKPTKGNYGCKAESTLSINNGGRHLTWGSFRGFTDEFAPGKDGSTVLTGTDGTSLAVDFSGRCGTGAMLVVAGAGEAAKSDAHAVIGAKTLSFLFLGKGTAPKLLDRGDKVLVREQTVTISDGKVKLGG